MRKDYPTLIQALSLRILRTPAGARAKRAVLFDQLAKLRLEQMRQEIRDERRKAMAA